MEGTMIRPQVAVGKLELDPTFEAGSTHTAASTLTNPTTKDFTYAVELYLGVTKVATSGQGTVTISAGQSKQVNFTMVMPTTEGDYQPYLDVWAGGELIAHYAATEIVSVAVTPAITVGPITWV